METKNIYPYSWYVDAKENEETIIRAYGLDEKDKNICITITGFKPHIYIELPNGIPWTSSKCQLVCNKLSELIRYPIKLEGKLVYRKKLYYYSEKTYPFIYIELNNMQYARQISWKLKYELYIVGINMKLKFKIHEEDVNPVLQFMTFKNLKYSSWCSFSYFKKKENDSKLENSKLTSCDEEYNISYNNINPKLDNKVSNPLILSWDIETYSNNHMSSKPDAKHPANRVFQISCILWRHASSEIRKYLLCLGTPIQKIVGEDVKILSYTTEGKMISGFAEFIREHNPNIMIGYNIFGFDIPYLYERACINNVLPNFDKLGFPLNSHGKMMEVKWGSSAFKNQKFEYMETEGRIWVDMLPLIKRDYTDFSTYSLKAVAQNLLKNVHKDLLTHLDLFRYYDIAFKSNKPQGIKDKVLGKIGHYCVMDSFVVLELFKKLSTWVGLCELSTICNVSPFTLFTQGQQIRVFSQVVATCKDLYVIDSKNYFGSSNSKFQGAYVVEPTPGLYEKVVPFDFCLSGNTLVSLSNGCSRRIDQMTKDEFVLGFNKDTNGYGNYSSINGLQIKGKRKTIKVWLMDGTTITTTPDHKFMLDNGEWCRADELKDKYVKCGIEYTEDKICEKEEKWSLKLLDKSQFLVSDKRLNLNEEILDMQNTKNRNKSLAFARIIGYVLSDGSIYTTISKGKNRNKEYKKLCVEVSMGTLLDAQNFKHDMDLFSVDKKDITIRKRSMGLKGTTFCITLPSYLSRLIHNLKDIVVGKRATQAMKLPSFLLEDDCPLSIIREFLGGLFGGDGAAPHYASTNRFGHMSFKWTTSEEYKNDMILCFENIRKMLNKLNIITTLITPAKIKYGEDSIQPKDITVNKRWDIGLNINEQTNLFLEKVGFRYCIHKSCRLSAVSSYQRMCDKTREQHSKVLNKVLEFNDKNKTNRQKLTIVQEEVFRNEPVINEYSLSSVLDINYQRGEIVRHPDRPRRLSLQPKKFPTPMQFLTETNTLKWFNTNGEKKYAVGIEELYIPSFRKKVIDVKDNGEEDVYDIEVNEVHNFIAQGICVSNCSLYPSTQIAYNIDYSTLVLDETIPDKDCNVMEWDEHINCEHDPSVIRKKEIEQILNKINDQIKDVRNERDKKINKNNKKKYNDEITKIKKNTETLRDEKKKLTKPKGQMVSCQPRKFRFLKSSLGLGVLPTLLQNLLSNRKRIREEIGVLTKKMKEEKDEEIKKDLSIYILVLDKRQNACKVSANSIYGSMGVKQGYLPFLPGAMCTTAMGRQNIKIAAASIVNDHKGILIYGDTDSTYVSFPHLTTAKELWNYSINASKEVSKLFPPPMFMDFEMKIFWEFMILTKKRYMCISCNEEGIMNNKMTKKGVLLNRRDNSNFVRNFYEKYINLIFNKKIWNEIAITLLEDIEKLFTRQVNFEDFLVTKSVGNIGDMMPRQVLDDKTGKMVTKIGDYKVKPLEKDDQKEISRLLELKHASNEKEYYLHCLPAQVQLAEKMKTRGDSVDAGTRIEYVVTSNITFGHDAKMFEKLESFDYFKDHKDVLTIDLLYYFKALTIPLDQVLLIIFGIRNFMMDQYKLRCKKENLINEIKDLFRPNIIIGKN